MRDIIYVMIGATLFMFFFEFFHREQLDFPVGTAITAGFTFLLTQIEDYLIRRKQYREFYEQWELEQAEAAEAEAQEAS